jgi:hypothetical protein
MLTLDDLVRLGAAHGDFREAVVIFLPGDLVRLNCNTTVYLVNQLGSAFSRHVVCDFYPTDVGIVITTKYSMLNGRRFVLEILLATKGTVGWQTAHLFTQI